MATKAPEQQQPLGNARVVTGIAGLFGQTEFADFQIVFTLDQSLDGQPQQDSGGSAASAEESGAGRKRAREGESRGRASGDRLACEPLPGHSFVLHFACDKIAAQLDFPRKTSDGAGNSKRARKAVTVTITAVDDTSPARSIRPQRQQQLPEVELSLASKEQLPAARAAIKFAYTGRIEVGSVREALQVWRQATYLQVKDCAAASLAAVRGMLSATEPAAAAPASAAARAGPGPQAAAGAPAVGAAAEAGAGAKRSSKGGTTASPPVLEFFNCAHLWPAPIEDTDKAFAALLTEAKQKLVAHFGDALAVLNKQQLYDQMRALPVVALEAVLESDDFGTDSESSVVLVLVEWMDANYSRTDADTRRRLCGLLRLSQCSRAYTSWVLPALAATHVAGPPGPNSWFPVTIEDVARLTTYVTASEAERKAMADEAGMWGPCAIIKRWPAGWLSSTPRRQCVPAEGRAFSFSASLAQLEAEFGGAKPGGLFPTFDDAPMQRVVVHGLWWGIQLQMNAADSSAVGCFFMLDLPDSLLQLGSEASQLMLDGVTAYPDRLRMNVHGFAGGAAAGAAGGVSLRKKDFTHELGIKSFVRVGRGVGHPRALKLQPAAADAPPPPVQQQPHAPGAAAAAVNTVAARWADYLRDGKLTGAITLLPPQ